MLIGTNCRLALGFMDALPISLQPLQTAENVRDKWIHLSPEPSPPTHVVHRSIWTAPALARMASVHGAPACACRVKEGQWKSYGAGLNQLWCFETNFVVSKYVDAEGSLSLVIVKPPRNFGAHSQNVLIVFIACILIAEANWIQHLGRLPFLFPTLPPLTRAAGSGGATWPQAFARALSSNSTVASLSLQNVKEAGLAVVLPALAFNAALRQLDLRYNRLTDVGAELVSGWGRLSPFTLASKGLAVLKIDQFFWLAQITQK